MVHKVYSISLPEELSMIIDDDPDLKLSKITQEAIKRILENRQQDPIYSKLQNKIQVLQAQLLKIQEKGL